MEFCDGFSISNVVLFVRGISFVVAKILLIVRNWASQPDRSSSLTDMEDEVGLLLSTCISSVVFGNML